MTTPTDPATTEARERREDIRAGRAMTAAPATLAMIPLDAIDPAPNVRADVGDVEGLASTIAELGLLQPVRVRQAGHGRYHVIVGSRRVAAAREAGEAFVPAVLDTTDPDAARDAIAQLVENLQRRDLNPMDQARALRTVLDADPTLTQKDLARRLGFTGAWLTNQLALLKAPPEVQLLAEQGRVTAEAVRRVITLPPERQVRLMQRWADGDLTFEGLEQAAVAERSSGTNGGNRPGARPHRSTRLRVLTSVGLQLEALLGDTRRPSTEEVRALDDIRDHVDALSGRQAELPPAPITGTAHHTAAASIAALTADVQRLSDLTITGYLAPTSLAAIDDAISDLRRIRQRCTPLDLSVRRGPA